MLKRIAVFLARQGWLRKVALSTPGVRDLAWRFVAGENLDAAVGVVHKLGRRGIRVTLNHVGTHVHEPGEARAATADLIVALRRIRSEGLDANVSVKPTQLGLDIDLAFCRAELRRLLDVAVDLEVFVWIDMEESGYVDRIIDLFEELRDAYGADRVGIVLQSYLRDRSGDLERLIDGGSRIRIVKGGYWEPAETVYRDHADIDRAFARDIRVLLERAAQPAIATHDPAIIAAVRTFVAKHGLALDSFEFQMLYGVRADLQEALARDGYQVRLYVPYGGDWFIYFLGCIRRIPGGVARRVSTRLRRLSRRAG